MARCCSASSAVTSVRANQILPELTGSRQAKHNASVLFPEPDGPTTASVVRGNIENVTPARARTSGLDANAPPLLYRFATFSALSSGSNDRPLLPLLINMF